jgi:hypothetical protein
VMRRNRNSSTSFLFFFFLLLLLRLFAIRLVMFCPGYRLSGVTRRRSHPTPVSCALPQVTTPIDKSTRLHAGSVNPVANYAL